MSDVFFDELGIRKPDHSLDVNSALACTLVSTRATRLCRSPTSRVGSAAATGPPEEFNRVVTDRLSQWLLCPAPDDVDNLRAEATPADRIHLFGNVTVDTGLQNLERAK